MKLALDVVRGLANIAIAIAICDLIENVLPDEPETPPPPEPQ